MNNAKIITKQPARIPTMSEFNDAFRRLTGPTGKNGMGWGVNTEIIGGKLALVDNGKIIKTTNLFAKGNGIAKEISKTQLLAEGINKH